MKAAYFETPGGPEVIQVGELPRPEPGSGEVLVRVGAAAVNPIDTYIRGGAVKMARSGQYIPGCDLAGTVEQVGDGARRFRPGDRVWGSNQGLFGRQGTFAEYASVKEEWLYPTPAGVTDVEAAAAALTAITAHLGLFRCANLKAGETVFVNGGTGGVGSMVVQLTKAHGARVIATVGSADKAKLCLSWGTDRVLNYQTDDVDAGIRDFVKDQGVQVWFETQRDPDFVRTLPLMGLRGRVIVIAGRTAQPVFPVGSFYTRDLTLYGFAMFNATPDEQRHCAEDVNRLLGEKKLAVLVGKTFPLSEAAAAHRLQEENTLHKAGTLMGKIVVTP